MSFRLIDPSEKLDFTANFADWLDSSVFITGTPVWTIFPTGPTLSSQTNTTTLATTFVEGCTLGVVYQLTCQIVTDAGVPQTAERTITLSCEQR